MTDDPSIPSTLDEAVDQLIAGMQAASLPFLATHSLDRCLGEWHHVGGTALRNEWHLWEHDSLLAKDLSARGAYHGDDRSGLIMSAVWHKVNGKVHDIAAEIESNRRHWAREGLNLDGTPIVDANLKTSFNLFVKRDGTVTHEDDFGA